MRMTINANRRQVWATAAALATAALALTGCSGGDKPAAAGAQPPVSPQSTASPQAPPGLPAEQTNVAQVWEQFFDAGTPVAVKQQLVQNGAALTAAVRAFTTDPATGRSTAKVTKVTFGSPDQATVTYDVLAFGKTRQSGATGVAVKTSAGWQVSAASLCTMVKPASGVGLPGCPGGS